MKRIFITIAVIIFMLPAIGYSQFENVNIDQLSDQQIAQYLNTATLSGISETEIEARAKQKGLSEEQISKLKARVEGMRVKGGAVKSAQIASNIENSTIGAVTATVTNAKTANTNGASNGVFGAEMFSMGNLTFEPNLRIATPRNYVLGVDDKLVIEIFGYSEVNFTLQVSSQGTVRIPGLGPVQVLGLTLDDAQKKIRKELTKIYDGIALGNTTVLVTLAQIRTIRVTMIGGVAKPGTYSVPSLATIANALYVSGGPSNIGSFRSIDLVRNGKTISTFDLYDFLINGDLRNNSLLQDDDIIRVNMYKKRVSITGAVKRPAIYEVKDGETLGNVLEYAGGFTDYGYRDFIRLSRLGAKEKEVNIISKDQYKTYELKTGDTYNIDNILERFSNRVVIKGALFHPGDYAIESTPTLRDLILKAGLKEDAYMGRAIVTRLKEDFTPEVMNFNVTEIINGTKNMDLKREDVVTIPSIFTLREKYAVTIYGEVNKPGAYEYADSLRLEDVILIAGGFKDAASNQHINVSRRIKNTDNENDTSTYAQDFVIAMHGNIISERNTGFLLRPYDVITVRKNPGYKEQVVVNIEGEVLYPGRYTLNKRDEKISDLVKRAGGLRQNAYAAGAVLLRNTFQGVTEQSLVESKIDVIKAQTRDTTSKESIINSLSDPQKLVGIHLDDALKNPNSIFDISLEEGDILRVPKVLETVQAFGAVFVPKKIVFYDGISFKQIVRQSGGFTGDALRRRSYVVHPNGEVRNTGKFLFFNFYPKIKRGSEVYVPLKKERKQLSTQELVAITTGVVGVATMVFGIISLSR